MHIPFVHRNYLEFCLQIKNRVKCQKVVFIGDLVDLHSFSFHHDIDPNGWSLSDEIKQSKECLKEWFKAFPEALCCLGNHDRRIDLKARHVGLPETIFKPFREIWELPNKWKDDFTHEIDGVLYTHGTGLSGDTAHIKAASQRRQSTVIGHVHHLGAMSYLVSEKDCLIAVAVGCGIDRHKYAFDYGRDFVKKPFLGCGVITDHGKYAQIFRMSL